MRMRLTVDLWLGVRHEQDGASGSVPPVRSRLEVNAREGVTGREFFDTLAGRYRSVHERVFDRSEGTFRDGLIFVLNDRVIARGEVYEKPLKDGDRIGVFPLDAGG